MIVLAAIVVPAPQEERDTCLARAVAVAATRLRCCPEARGQCMVRREWHERWRREWKVKERISREAFFKTNVNQASTDLDIKGRANGATRWAI